ncbi:Ferredoxin:thioredoxin reductase [Candidatus Desulfarcum epimagneticum]|uniref:ferredoxin:thioredoxin reductase n=1 Tax=uncultured Desulfobacteraceae bacterium TaxID=218296 RepID=A0A484HGS7_9BACT|nr:Ferredoxin:thioredoxin reductase [uncultured Desulfobacteraceae bacterium]
MEPDALYEKLKKVQEPKGYYFNKDREKVMALLNSLETNRRRYGHMACPCRLASGDQEKDRDIICPCVYREADVKEFGACYCALYVSEEYNQSEGDPPLVPERRPPERMF